MNRLRGQGPLGPDARTTPTTGVEVIADLVVITLVTGSVLGLGIVYGPEGGPVFVRVPLGLLFVFVLPGYAITSALFPAAATDGQGGDGITTVTATERIVLSIGLSVVVVPLVGLTLTMVLKQLTVGVVLGGVGLVVLVSVTIAAVRRFGLPPKQRFAGVPQASLQRGIQYTTANFVNLFLVMTIVFSLGGIGFVLASSGGGEQYTELSLLGIPDEDDGNVTYPSTLEANDSQSLVVEVTNQEQRAVEYTVVVMAQELASVNETRMVSRSVQLDEFTLGLSHGERARYQHEIRPTFTSENLQLVYLLYLGEPPPEPTVSNAYRTVHLSVDVTDSEQ